LNKMGHIIDNTIAKETKAPLRFSSSGKPNFVEFDKVNNPESSLFSVELHIQHCGYVFIRPGNGGTKEYENRSKFALIVNGTKYLYEGISDEKSISDKMFYLGPKNQYGPSWEYKKEKVAENLKMCLLKSNFFNTNFDIDILPVKSSGSSLKNGSVIYIKAKSINKAYSFEIDNSDPSLPTGFISLENETGGNYESDSILKDKDSVELQLDIYKDAPVFPGQEDFEKMGTHITTLSKTYFGQPVWFDVNSLWTNQNKYSDAFLEDNGVWTSAGTATGFRFTAKKYDGVNSETFYYSDVLYTITGYGRTLDKTDITKYVFNPVADNDIKFSPLTKQPALIYIKGQTQYFNFILSDPEHGKRPNDKDKLRILYKLRSQSGNYIGEVTKHEQKIDLFDVVNTIRLEIDSILDEYPKTGIVEAYLSRNGKTVSEPLTFTILPAHLYKVNDFAFLNSLGGWSSFNFGGTAQTDFKSDTTTIFRTLTPDFNTHSRIESVFNKEVTEQFIVQTSPIKAEVADWLKEMSASIAVYELSTKRYIIIDELNVKHNTKDDLFTLQMKYHYSDGYKG